MKIVLDHYDYNILELLNDNARLSYAEIGRLIGLSQSAAKERVISLVDRGVIKKFGIEVDYSLIGYSLPVLIHLKFRNDDFKIFLNQLQQFPEITSCKRVTGEYCLVAEAVLKDNSHLEHLIDRLIRYGIPSTAIRLSEVGMPNFFTLHKSKLKKS
ncbi:MULTISPECIES: Lrp/AsnC family transcriptional regulator [Chryseobacterium]|uniref:Lrp/AsnC family leucine-responsive transcriptional regulator n=1 Tax=Chryseobacterium camelliae TaxID=1265445 RepID=A0ABU0TIE3_9FLAO|nr:MULTISPECIES: Lrp/AsnC family transcriptional regulator [Chryseobacterium]MDT3406274.1 Lrp/AsnC family leucine-responsive transcriptional regulator [Pseudacidovorax intermedius]MDQ1095928.1 Lrp/AsnC family leucine-responsive transcriptional regulator [Chryseobacterium camelliae]MDQ1099864.1 Lrp/AsnC family leucine-responsive transcriptional regulator [Chryseobacterium sp. SORGH_AS_1048]MDR6087210.1 Lrp/AsnC family leucine-responsive transcriptional regulator [Chryseobacterium sp. SORGH_AS_09